MDGHLRTCWEDRFWDKVAVGPECWYWLGAKNDEGYGQLYVDGKMAGAHRLAYELVFGPLGQLHIDHRCRNHSCVNPAHLEGVTNKENTLRGEGITAHLAKATHCVAGHEFSVSNTYVRKDTGHRQCKQCSKDRKNAT